MSKENRSVGRLTMVVSITAALLPAIAIAQTSSQANQDQATQTVLEEVTVKAQRYSSELQKTPISVTALTAADFEARQIITVQDLVSSIPGVQLSQNTSAQSQMKVTFRGARTETGGIRSNGTVGIYIDGVIQPRPMGSFFNLADVAQVEVLRGPQGTLYGRNTSGGAINIQTKKPTNYWGISGEIGVGNYNGRDGQVYISGPIINDKLSFSLSGSHNEREGFLYGLQDKRNIGDQYLSTERFKLSYEPTDNLTFDLAVYGIQDKSEPVIPVPLTNLPGVVNPYAYRGRDLTWTEMKYNLDQSIKQWGVSLNVSWSLTPELSLNSISGYGDMETYNHTNDTFLTAARQAANGGALDLRSPVKAYLEDDWITQEFNALYMGERFEAVAGLFYFREEGWTQNRTNGVATDLQKSLVTAPAVFGQMTYHITDAVSLVGGLRYTRETNDYYSHNFSSSAGVQLGKSVFTSTTPKLGVNWQVTPNVFTYASWAQGTRGGGFNTRTLDGELTPNPYDAEWVDSYEIGGKFESANRRFRLNAALFEANYSDQQLVSIISGPGYVALYYTNAGGSRVRGLELESSWQATNDLNLYAVAAFQDGKYTKQFNCFSQRGQLHDCTNNKLKGVPDEKFSLGFQYTPSLQKVSGELSFNGSWDHTSRLYNHSSNPLPPPDNYGSTPPLDLFNASIRWVGKEGRWHASFEGRNLTNKIYVEHGYTSSNAISPGVVGYMGRPRELWFRVGYSTF